MNNFSPHTKGICNLTVLFVLYHSFVILAHFFPFFFLLLRKMKFREIKWPGQDCPASEGGFNTAHGKSGLFSVTVCQTPGYASFLVIPQVKNEGQKCSWSEESGIFSLQRTNLVVRLRIHRKRGKRPTEAKQISGRRRKKSMEDSVKTLHEDEKYKLCFVKTNIFFQYRRKDRVEFGFISKSLGPVLLTICCRETQGRRRASAVLNPLTW